MDSRLFPKTKPIVEVRINAFPNGGGEIYNLTQEDLDDESKYQNTHKDPQKLNPRIQELKDRNFTRRESYDAKNLSREEREVLFNMNRNAGINGAKLVEILKQAYDEMKSVFDKGGLIVIDSILFYEKIMNQLPELLDSLVKKGALLEQPSLSNKLPTPKR